MIIVFIITLSLDSFASKLMILFIFHYTNIPGKVECSQKNEGDIFI